MPSPPTRPWMPSPHVGHSGAMLITLGAIWILIGAGLAHGGDAPIIATLWPVSWIPTPARALIWIVGGSVAVLYAFRPRSVVSASLAWTLLYIPPAIRALAYAVGWADHITPGGGPGYDRGWLSALVYVAICVVVMIASRWPDPDRTLERP